MKKGLQNKSNKPPVKVGDYVIGKTLGKGAFGKVKSAIHSVSLQQVAVKIIKTPNSVLSIDIEREINVLKLLKHPNIVKLIDIIKGKDKIYIVLELVKGGELFDRIVSEGHLPEKDARKLFRQLVSVVEYCHGNLVVHRDLKPENILLDNDGNIKVTDFGLSNFIKPGEYFKTSCGSPVYSAPEILKGGNYAGTKSDIWSLGIVLYAMVAGHLPWPIGNAFVKSVDDMCAGRFNIPERLSPDLKSLLRIMINPKPHTRASMLEVKTHPWVNSGHTAPPPCFLEHRAEGVTSINEQVLSLLKPLEFDIDEARVSILNNEKCIATSIYYLFLEQTTVKAPGVDAVPKIINRARTTSLSSGTPATEKITRRENRLSCDPRVILPTHMEDESSSSDTQPSPSGSPGESPSGSPRINVPQQQGTGSPEASPRTKKRLSLKLSNIFKIKKPTPPPSPRPIERRRHSADVVDEIERRNIIELAKLCIADESSMRAVKSSDKSVTLIKDKTARDVVELVQDLLTDLQIIYDQEGYLFKCTHETQAQNGATAASEVTFEVEVCRVKRTSGDVWAYKPIFILISSKLKSLTK